VTTKLPIVERLEAELARFRRELSTELPKQIEEARAHGDLRENAEYHAAKERQAMVSARVAAIEDRLRSLAMYNLSSIPRGVAGYGSHVEVEDCDSGERVRYQLVFPEEVDPARGLVSMSSPLGQAMLNRAPGDEVKVRTPGGARTLEIVEVTTIHVIIEEGSE